MTRSNIQPLVSFPVKRDASATRSQHTQHIEGQQQSNIDAQSNNHWRLGNKRTRQCGEVKAMMGAITAGNLIHLTENVIARIIFEHSITIYGMVVGHTAGLPIAISKEQQWSTRNKLQCTDPAKEMCAAIKSIDKIM